MADNFEGDPNVVLPMPPMGNPPPSSSVATPQTAQNPAPFSTPSVLGRVAKKIFTGEETNYNYDDQGNLVQTNTPMKPGSLFRHIVAGALLGGALGSQDPRHTFSGGFAAGSAGVMQDEQRKDALRRKQAQEAFEMRMKGKQSLREDQKLGIEQQKLELEKREQKNKDDLAKAQTMLYTSEVAKNNELMQGASLKRHMENKEFYAPIVDLYTSLGLEPKFKVSEKEAADFLKSRPDAASLKPVVIDVKPGVDAQGNPTHEFIYGLYDLSGQTATTAIPEPVKKMWKSIGFDKTHPEYFAPGAKVDANSLVAAQQQALKLYNDNILQQKGQFSNEKLQAEAAEARARAAHYLMETAKGKTDLKKDAMLQEAMKDFEDHGRQLEGMKPEHKPYIAEFANRELANKNALYRAAVADAEKEELTNPAAAKQSRARANEIAREMDDLDKLTDVFSPKPLSPDKLPRPGKETLITSTEGQAAFREYERALKDPVKVREAMLKNGWTLPKAEVAEPAKGSTLDTVLPYVQDWFGGREKYQKK